MPKAVKADFPQEKWNKKRLIILAVLILALIIGGLELKTYVLGDQTLSSVKGASISPAPTVKLPNAQSIGQGVQDNLGSIKQEINKINIQEIATSSPQVQKVLNDIKALPAVPGQQAKSICMQLCNGL